ncbi:MAG: hypothetical protein V3V07_07650 [candidate division NC10 bacterium]|jgi:hypothetical protein
MSSTGELFGQGNQLRRTVTLKELGLTGDAWGPLFISVVAFLLAALSGLLVTLPAWYTLGVGRPFVPEFLLPVTAFMLLVITTGGLSIAWGGGTVSLLALWEVLGGRTTFTSVRMFAGLSLLMVWFIIGALLHVLGTPGPGMEAKLLSQNPALHFPFYAFHRFNDIMHFVFVGGALGMIWVYGEGLLHNRLAQVVTLVLIWLTFYSLSLTLGIDSAAARVILG